MIHAFLVIVGSVRPQRIGPKVARWIIDIGRSALPSDFELIDLPIGRYRWTMKPTFRPMAPM